MAGEGSGVSSDLDAVAGELAERLGWKLKHAECSYSRVLAPDDVVAGLATRSYLAPLDDAERDRLLDSVGLLLATHPDTAGCEQIDVPYRTFAYRLEAQPRSSNPPVMQTDLAMADGEYPAERK